MNVCRRGKVKKNQNMLVEASSSHEEFVQIFTSECVRGKKGFKGEKEIYKQFFPTKKIA